MLSSLKQVQYPNVIINDLIIRNASTGMLANSSGEFAQGIAEQQSLEINLIKEAKSIDPLGVYSLSFVEDMEEPHVSGSLILVDKSNIFDNLGIRTNAEIEMDISFGDTIDNNFNYKVNKKKLFFNIVDIETINDIASQDVNRDVGTPNYLNIRFSSKEFVHSDFVGHSINYDRVLKTFDNFIGPISAEYNYTIGYDGKTTSTIKTDKIDDQIKIKTKVEKDKDQYGNIVMTLPQESNTWPAENPTFFGNLITRYNQERKSTFSNRPPKGFKSHATSNDIWIKPEYFFYPSFKNSSIPRLTQLIHYVKNYACLKEDPNFVDFMFWEDLDGFNFKSIAKMVQESSGDTPLFFPDSNPQNMEAIISLDVIKDTEPMDLIASGALVSEYIRVKPNWKSPYRNILSGEEQYSKELIKYSYKEDILERSSPIKRINDVIITNKRWPLDNRGYSPFSSSELNITSIKSDFNSMAFRISDEIYGFYDSAQYNSKYSPWWSFLDKNNKGFTYKSVGTIDYNGDQQGLTYNFNKLNRLEEEYWQSQFDFCELPGTALHVIYNKIKWPLEENRQKYVEAKKLNEKWKFYFDNICCERKVPLNFFALLTGADKIYGGLSGTSFQADPGGIYAYKWVEVEFWPREDVDAILKTGDEIIKFENQESYPFVFVKPKGALEGTIPLTRKYENKIKKYDIKGSESKAGQTYLTKDTRAYNINEILNCVGLTFPKGFDTSKIPTSVKTNLKDCKFFITNPGLAFPIDDTKTTCKTSYPKGFEMMPIGTFRFANECSDSQKWPFGRIVQMHAIPREIMQTIAKGEQGLTGICSAGSGGASITVTPMLGSSETTITLSKETKSESEKAKYLFVFDVVNAHDGLCDNTCSV